MKNVLITGGTGFLGIHLFDYLKKLGYKVYLLDKGDRVSRLKYYDKNQEYYKYDLGNYDLCNLPELDIIIHLAALPHVDYSFYHPQKTINNNIDSLLDVLEYAKEKKVHIIFASSVEVYSSTYDNVSFTEDMEPNPVSPYGVSKVACEMILKNYARCYNLKYNIFRLTNLYGEYQLPDRIIPRTICRILNNLPVEIDKGFYRDFLYVKDACCGIEKIMNLDTYGEIFNLSSEHLFSMEETAKEIINYMMKGTLHINDVGFAGKQRYHMLRISNNKASTILDWKPEYSIQQGIEKTVDWYTDSLMWYSQFNDSVYSSRENKNFIIDCNY